MSREACLRPEFAALYPALRSGQWEPAVITVEKLVADLFLRHRAGMNSVHAACRLNPEHFDFRDGPRHDVPGEERRPRMNHRQPGVAMVAAGDPVTPAPACRLAFPSPAATREPSTEPGDRTTLVRRRRRDLRGGSAGRD